MEGDGLACLRVHIWYLHRDRADAGLHSPFRMVAVVDHARMTLRGLSVLRACHENLEPGLDRRVQQFPSTLAQKFRQWVRDRISNGKFNNDTLLYGGATSSVGRLCRNDNPTRCTASLQIPKTTDSVKAPFSCVRFVMKASRRALCALRNMRDRKAAVMHLPWMQAIQAWRLLFCPAARFSTAARLDYCLAGPRATEGSQWGAVRANSCTRSSHRP